MKSILSNKYLYLISLLLFIENIALVSMLSSLVIAGGVIYFYFFKKYELSLVFLLLSSAYVNTSYSIYDLKLFYVLLFIISILAINKNELQISKKWAFIYISFFTFYTILGFIFVVYGANLILNFIVDDKELLSGYILYLMLITYFLELHHSLSASIYVSTNDIPFVVPSIVSGVSIVILGYCLMGYYSLLGIVFAQFLVQIVFNNWYPTYKLLKYLEIPFKEYMLTLTKGVK